MTNYLINAYHASKKLDSLGGGATYSGGAITGDPWWWYPPAAATQILLNSSPANQHLIFTVDIVKYFVNYLDDDKDMHTWVHSHLAGTVLSLTRLYYEDKDLREKDVKLVQKKKVNLITEDWG